MKNNLFFLILISLIISFSSCSYIYQAEATQKNLFNSEQINIVINNKPVVMSKPIEEIDGCALVDVEEFSKLIGAKVYWDNEADTIYIRRGNYYVEFYTDSRSYSCTDRWEDSTALDVSARVMTEDNILYVPLIAMAEKLNFSVTWEESTKIFSLTDIEKGYANTLELFLAEIDKHINNLTEEFTIVTERLSLETLTNISLYFYEAEDFKYIYYELDDSKIEISYKIDYSMYHRILNAHQTNNINILDENELAVYNKALEIISKEIVGYMTDYEKELSLHDYIVKNTTYSNEAAEAISLGEYKGNAGNPYGALIEGSAVCGGYSEAFKLLLEMNDIECDVIYGTVIDGEGHAWNRVKLDEKYYLVDVTWNDSDRPDMPDFVSYEYLNITDEQINKSRITASISSKKSDATLYNYYRYNNLLVESQMDFDAIIKSYAEDKVKSISVRGNKFNVKDLKLDKVGQYYSNSFKYYISEKTNTLTILLN